MKKSKFLKKSLAMLLAVMLVVAMIPLSAAASDPNLYQVWAEVDGERALLSQDGNTFTGSYKAGAQEVTLQIVVGTGNLVYYTNMDDGQAVDTNVQLGQGGNPDGVAEVNLDVDLYTNDEGNFEVNFAVVDKDVPSDRKSYKLVLEPKVLSTETLITDFELNRVQGNTIPNWETAQIGVDFVSVTMPYDAINSDITTYQIRNMKVSAGATWTITHADGTTTSGDSTGVVSGVNMTDNQAVTVEDGDVIAISNNGRTARYTLHISVADGFTYFQTAEGLDAVKFSDTGDIVVLLPFGTAADADGGDITVTPIFELDYPSATAYWNDGDKRVEIDGVDDAITIDSNIIVDGTQLSGDSTAAGYGATYRTFEGDGVDDWAYRKANNKEFDSFTSSIALTGNPSAVNGIKAAKQNGHAATITLKYADEAERDYNVYFCETQLNNATTIDELVIGSEVAEIDEENATIDITLPNGTNLASVNLSNASDTTEATMTAAFGAEIDFVIPSLDWTGSGPRSATQTFAADSTPVDLRQPVSVRVLSQDNRITGNEKVYTLNVNASSEYQEAEITSFTLKNEALDYFFTGTPDQNGQVIMKVPYEIYDEILLGGNGWQFFYTKTVGTLATVNGETLPVSGRTIPTFSDGDNSLFDIIFPDVLSPESKVTSAAEGGAIEVRMIGEDLTENSMRYRLVLQRVPAKTESQLDSFSLVGKRAWEVPGCSTTYLGTVTQPKTAGNGNTGSIVANTSWTAAQYWTDDNTMNAIAEVVEDSNARVFFKGTASTGQVYYMQLVNFGDTSANNAKVEDVTSTKNHWILHEDTEVVVLSEEFWVELLEDGAFTASQNDPNGSWFTAEAFAEVRNGSNGSNYTVYTLNLNDDVRAEEGATLKELTLMDGTGWTDTLTVDAEEHHLVGADGKIPYALTSDLDADGNLIDNGTDTSVNPVFLTYDFNPGNRAYVLATDSIFTVEDQANMTTAAGTNRVPTAGDARNKGGETYPVSGDGVFYDLDALDNEDWTEDKFDTYMSEGLPFLLISREGKVYVYHWDDTDGYVIATRVEDNSLTICSENGGDAFQTLDFDLDVAEPNAGTTFSEFYFIGFERFKGNVDASTHTITVELPYGTDLSATEYTYLIPKFDFTADSQGAIVTVDDPELLGKPVRSGVTNVNFTTTRKFTVIAENENKRTEWTVNVQVADRYSDVKETDWFYDDVMDASKLGYVNGVGDGVFGPKNDTTRAQFAKILAEALGYDPAAYTESAFPDVADDHWAKEAIAFCVDQEIILGYDDGEFKPSKTITRQEAALMLQRAFDLQGVESNAYPDDAKIAGWAKDGVYAVKHSGLMKGDADTGNFRPTSTMNRAEMATILMNAHRSGLIK